VAEVAERLSSVDAFRGITMAGMVIVNNPGTWDAIYWPLEHAEWNGWTPTDLIFPFFVFLVGVSLTLSWQTQLVTPGRIFERGLLIICLGLFMAGFPFFNPFRWRFPGVLQRIGLCYLAAAFIYRRTRSVKVIAAIVAALLLGYWLVLVWFGDLTPDGNIGARIDRALMGGHLWRPTWDPEGLLSTVPAIATALLGVVAGLWLKSPVEAERKVNVLALAGIAGVAAGQAWHLLFPINKQLWTSSYVLLTAGAAAILLAACMYVIDIRGFRAWSQPFVVLGRNAIALFVVSGLIGKLLILIPVHEANGTRTVLQSLIFDYGFQWMGPPQIASLAYALVFLALMYGLCHFLYRRGIFLRA
jgi:predicted acyltransferase